MRLRPVYRELTRQKLLRLYQNDVIKGLNDRHGDTDAY